MIKSGSVQVAAALPLEPVINFPTGGAGSQFSQFAKRGVTNIGNLRATSDKEMRKIGPSPSGCGENRAILRCRAPQWGRHSLRPPPRLARFSLATLPARKLITGSNDGDTIFRGAFFRSPLADCKAAEAGTKGK